MDLLSKMSTYVRVVESGSFAAAAKQLRVSSAAVSRQVATLERELDISLIARTTRKMVVTPAGRGYYERCLRILHEVDDAQSIARGEHLDGPLRISAPVTFGLACVVPEMRGLMKSHPGIVVDLHLEDRLIDLIPEGVDVAIRVGSAPPESTELIAQKLFTYERVLVAAPPYLRAHGTPKRPESLAKYDALMHLMAPADTWTLRDGDDEVRVRPKIVFRTNALHALRELAIEGAGVALLPHWFVLEALSSGELRRILSSWRADTVTANAIHRRTQRGEPRVLALIDHLRKAYARPAYRV